MLTITKLKGAEYLISSVAAGVEDYHMGAGEAPGVWRGRWSARLGLVGVVTPEQLRALVDGRDPRTGLDLLAGHRDRKVRALDVTLSVPKSVSLLWAFGTPEVSSQVSIAVVEATGAALGFLEERAAVARVQQGGRRRQTATGGFAVATFAHRTSRAGDPQLHTHCLIPNVVERSDGVHVAFDAYPLHTWAKATGTVFLNHLERLLSQRLGVEWGPERNGTRELVGFSREQLRAFSKRTTAIETRLEADGEVAFDSKAERMRADDRASLATRNKKDRTLTPERLRDRWHSEAGEVGLEPGETVDRLVCGRRASRTVPAEHEIFAALVDPQAGLCATDSRFNQAHVIERVAAISAGRMSTDDIVDVSRRFLASDLVVRLAADRAGRRPAEWSTVELRAVEDRLLAHLHHLTTRPAAPIDRARVAAAIDAEPITLGPDQAEAVTVLCGAGPSVRLQVAPAGYGKTTAVHAAVTAARWAGRPVVALAPTHKAVGELRRAGIDAHTVAHFRTHTGPLDAGTVVVVDETSQLATRDAETIFASVTATEGGQMWMVGDSRQAQPVAAGGLAHELDRLAAAGTIPTAVLEVNRRQLDPAEREALDRLRVGDVDASQTIRGEHGWEHQHPTAAATRQALAQAAVADADRHGADQIAVLAVSHTDCEDLADRIRHLRADRGELRGPTLAGPGWTGERTYAAGDRILIHTNTLRSFGVHNGTTGTVLGVAEAHMTVLCDDTGYTVTLDPALVAGTRTDGTPNVSHAWARTVDGAQGGTWRQVHLLGSPALDTYRGYVGQSRGRHPTHTWNTRAEADHPASLLVDDRTPGETVADALRRDTPKRFAAGDDPWTVDRQLRAERDAHQQILAAAPPDVTVQHLAARDRLAAALAEHDQAVAARTFAHQQRDAIGPLAALHRDGRQRIADADQHIHAAGQRVDRLRRTLPALQADYAQLEQANAVRQAWKEQHAWRYQELWRIDAQLAEHWAHVVLDAARADDPLGFGVDRLRAARAWHHSQLANLDARLPADRRHHLHAAEADLHRAREHVRYAEGELRQAERARVAAEQRHWSRKDKTAIAHADADLRAAQLAARRTSDELSRAQARVDDERRAVDQWARATRETEPERAALRQGATDLDHALTDTRAQRVLDAADNPLSPHWQTLGPRPTTRGGLDAWCGIAERIEAFTDLYPTDSMSLDQTDSKSDWLRHTPQGQQRQELLDLIERAPAIIDHADRADRTRGHTVHAEWQTTLRLIENAIAIEPPAPTIDHDPGLGL